MALPALSPHVHTTDAARQHRGKGESLWQTDLPLCNRGETFVALLGPATRRRPPAALRTSSTGGRSPAMGSQLQEVDWTHGTSLRCRLESGWQQEGDLTFSGDFSSAPSASTTCRISWPASMTPAVVLESAPSPYSPAY